MARKPIWMLVLAAMAMVSLCGCGYSTGPDDAASADADNENAVAAGEDEGDQGGRLKDSYQLGGGYVLGSVHPRGVKTVYVEAFQSQDWRRGLEIRLTEALVKRILHDTPYRIAPKDEADTIIYGEIAYVSVTLLGNDFDSDLPREIQPVITCDWTWKNRRTGQVLAQRKGMQQASEALPLIEKTYFFDATEEGIDDLAERIVEAMEAPW